MSRFSRALACWLVLVGALAIAVPSPAGAAESRAVVVIDTGAGSRRAVISFSGTITGTQALQLAGANPSLYGYSGQGGAVCKLDGVGHDPTDDGCLGTPSDPRYWAYFRATDGAGAWTYSRQCACSSSVSDGDVEGWRFGTGQPPPFASFCSVVGCAPAPTPSGGGESAANGNGAGAGGSTSAGGTAGGSAAPGAGATPGSAAAPGGALGAPADEGGAAAAAPTTVVPVTTSTPANPRRAAPDSSDGRDGQALSVASGDGDGDGDSGSPWGLIVAGGVAIGVVGAGLARRRRRTIT